ncbi:PREDICTED: uncharacterized protein C19orf69 homolog [Chrysochloris asiatica]|uniref:Uncharacterized protein C19orf69 homolog n=1 Tax=Chrysochloris asiatica TaxID=185453 RepID=A0A9B0WXH6_CHRAS|nr:PREDICTED: uncharacterized protein C19orf69 homolog [Chrysochloris asiatica]
MEQWNQLRQAGLLPEGLGPPPRALSGFFPMGKPDQTLMFPETDSGGARETLLSIWEELGNLRRMDVQLLDQLCSLALEMGILQEELAAILEEEEEESCEEEEEDEETQREQEEEDLGAPWLATHLPDFEMTI